jgi:hypothetical protein
MDADEEWGACLCEAPGEREGRQLHPWRNFLKQQLGCLYLTK